MYPRLRRLLAHPRATLAIVALATALVVSSVPAGLAADDFLHELMLREGHALPALRHGPLDLFRFATPATNQALVDAGVLPWWTDPEARFAFLRPLSSLTHVVDHWLFPGSAAAMHLHTVLWHVGTLLAAAALFRRVHGAGPLAALSLCLYALDDARGAPVAWVANRNELVAVTLSLGALLLHLRERARGAARLPWGAALLLGVALLASEGALAVTAYLFAWAVFAETGSLRARLLSLAPATLVVGGWAIAYRALGYGVARSGVYFDPIGATGSYLRALPERFSMLWLAQLGGPWSEGWNAYPVMFPGLELWVAGLAVLVLGIWAVAFRPLLRDDPRMRFWLGGALLATLPACSAFPADRLLPWIAVGASAATAQVFLLAVEHRGRLARLLAHGVVGAHLVVGPLLLPVRAAGITQVRASIERADRGIPRDPSIGGVDVVLVNPPADPFASYLPITRAALGVPLPASQRWLLTGARPVDVERVDDHTLRLRANGGLFLLPSERLLRDPRTRPFAAGAIVETAGLTLEIVEVTPEGAPEVVLARFARPLDDPRTRFYRWEGDGFVPLERLAPGETRRLPPADLVAVAYGKDSAVTRRFGAR